VKAEKASPVVEKSEKNCPGIQSLQQVEGPQRIAEGNGKDKKRDPLEKNRHQIWKTSRGEERTLRKKKTKEKPLPGRATKKGWRQGKEILGVGGFF